MSSKKRKRPGRARREPAGGQEGGDAGVEAGAGDGKRSLKRRSSSSTVDGGAGDEGDPAPEQDGEEDEDGDADTDDAGAQGTRGAKVHWTQRRLKQEWEDFVAFSKTDRAGRLSLAEDRLAVTGFEGFRSCRVNHGVPQGKWFCEVHVLEPKESASTSSATQGAHVRLGWSTLNMDIECPVGFDANSFGYRDVDGSKVNDGWRTEYGQGFGPGDVIGMLVDGHDSRGEIRFFRNGKDQGVAFDNVPWKSEVYGPLKYFATASLFRNARVRLNPGPQFSHALPEGALPLSDVVRVSRPQSEALDPGRVEIKHKDCAEKVAPEG